MFYFLSGNLITQWTVVSSGGPHESKDDPNNRGVENRFDDVPNNTIVKPDGMLQD